MLTFKVLDKTGPVVAARMVTGSQELIVISRDGIVLRTRVDGISIQGRATQGVAIIGVSPGDAVGSVATIDMKSQQGAADAEGPEPDAPADSTNGAAKAGPTSAAEGKKQRETNPVREKKALGKADAAMRKADGVIRKTRAAKSNGKRPDPPSRTRRRK